MKKKQYISPALSVYQVSTCEVICGSGETNPTMYSGSGSSSGGNGPIIQPGGFAGGDASGRRGWDDYEGM